MTGMRWIQTPSLSHTWSMLRAIVHCQSEAYIMPEQAHALQTCEFDHICDAFTALAACMITMMEISSDLLQATLL